MPAGGAENPNRIKPLADDFVVVCKSPNPQRIYCFTPGICRLPSGRLVATCDLGGPGVKGPRGRIFVSELRGPFGVLRHKAGRAEMDGSTARRNNIQTMACRTLSHRYDTVTFKIRKLFKC